VIIIEGDNALRFLNMYLPAKPGPVAADSRPGAANAEGKEQGLGKESLA